MFYQAALPKRVWDLAIEVMDLFECVKLNEQKLNLSTLLTKPVFKQQYLAPIHRLEKHDQFTLLQKVVDGECSLSELKSEASELKHFHALRAAFLRLTNAETWEEAEEKYPVFVTDTQLRKFLKVDLTKAIPHSFMDFCTRAKLSETELDAASSSSVIKDVCSYDYILTSKLKQLLGQAIKDVYPYFRGAHLAIVSIGLVYKLQALYIDGIPICNNYSYHICVVNCFFNPDVSRMLLKSW